MKALYKNYFRNTGIDDPIVKVLKNVPIFEDLSKKELSEVARLTHERTYKIDEYIFKSGVKVGSPPVIKYNYNTKEHNSIDINENI